MDVELQILGHFERDARRTVSLVDQYCRAYTISQYKYKYIKGKQL
jgi:hypothetical protein